MMYSAVRLIVEYMAGETRVFERVGGAMNSPVVAGDGLGNPGSNVVLNVAFKPGHAAPAEHLATIPLCNIRMYRVEAA